MTTPLWILAFLAAVAGIINLPFVLSLEHWLEPAIGAHEAPSVTVELLGIMLSILISFFGLLMAWAYYIRHEAWPANLAKPFGFMRNVIDHKWYVDELYGAVVVRPLNAATGWFARVFDPKVIDGTVNAVGDVTVDAGEAVRKLQNGAIPTYAFSIFLGVVVVLIYFIFAG
jgi:NADH-quinone oxidoreductase subunit L